jgi:hypothetical protein
MINCIEPLFIDVYRDWPFKIAYNGRPGTSSFFSPCSGDGSDIEFQNVKKIKKKK